MYVYLEVCEISNAIVLNIILGQTYDARVCDITGQCISVIIKSFYTAATGLPVKSDSDVMLCLQSY